MASPHLASPHLASLLAASLLPASPHLASLLAASLLPGLRPPRRFPRAGRADQPDPVHQLDGLGRLRRRGGGQDLAQGAAGGRGERRVLLPGQRHGDRDHLGRREIQRGQGQRLVEDSTFRPPRH